MAAIQLTANERQAQNASGDEIIDIIMH